MQPGVVIFFAGKSVWVKGSVDDVMTKLNESRWAAFETLGTAHEGTVVWVQGSSVAYLYEQPVQGL
jgi:hypothetical protein